MRVALLCYEVCGWGVRRGCSMLECWRWGVLLSGCNHNRMFRQTDDFPSFLSSPRHSPSKSAPKHPLLQLIAALSKNEHATFAALSQKCSALEYSLANIEVYAARLADRTHQLTESRESAMLGGLKMKQYEFIIGELKSAAAKQGKKEERLAEELEAEKRKAEKLREENYRLEAKQTALVEKVGRLEAQARERGLEREGAEREGQRVRTEEGERMRSKSKANLETSGSVICTEEYRELEAKLEELEREFNQEVEKLMAKNSQLATDFRRSQEESQQLRTSARISKKETDELRISRYELQLKLKQQSTMSSELEESYNRLIQKTNGSEIVLHRQIQDYKIKETDLRNELKREKRSFRSLLSNIAESVNNNSKYYLTAHSPEAQVEEIKKLHEKNLKKKVENAAREVEFYRAECAKLKAKWEGSEARVAELERKERNERVEKSEKKGKPEGGSEREIDRIEGSEGGSFMNPGGSEKSEEEKYRNVQQKYKTKLETLRKDVKAKQAKINELQKLQQSEFDRSKEKILELELAISQKGNDLRKAELKMREKEYEIQELKNGNRELQSKVAFLTDKMETEKEAASKLAEMKAQSYEEKLRTVRTACKQVERKQQEKTVKYNKLKTKLEKYELEASESLKRKNQQIEQLLRDNSKAKAENQLLEEKLNITQIIENETAKTRTPHPVNQDLIDQIQMESDRLASALADQHARNQQLADSNLQLSNDLMAVRREAIELRVRIEELARSERVLTEECRFAKEKIEELTRAGEENREEKHSYFKKELEKAVVAGKKMEKQMAERENARRQVEKQLEEVTNELTPLRNNFEKLKEKNSKLSDEILDQKEAHKKAAVDYERKLSECNTKVEQLITIIEYKNREGTELRESMKGEELLIEQEAKIKVDQSTNTPSSQTHHTATNTDPVDPHPLPERKIIPSQLILDEECFQIGDLREQSKQNKSGQVFNREQKVINYFGDLVLNTQNMQEHFQICEEGEELNIGVSSLNLQIKEIFNALRKEIQKIFNEEDISLSLMKLLPRSLEDDFNEFVAYIKDKIYEIKRENNLSFIMAEPGNEPSFHPIQTELADFLAAQSHEQLQLRKIIEEKEILITSLMNEKTEQENTINQLTVEKEEVEEENENRFMNQCNIYKREIKEHKKNVDLLEMNCQSLRNIFRNLVDIWLEPTDNEDDLKDNLVLYANITKLNEQDKKKLSLFLQKYREAHPR